MSIKPDSPIELSPELLVGFCDQEGRWQRTSTSWKACLGWEAAELSARSLVQLTHPDERAFLRQILSRPSEPGVWQKTTLRILDKKGAAHWIQWSLQWMHGEPSCYWVGHDITEAKHKEELSTRFYEALETVTEGIWEIDADGRCLYVNPAMSKMLDVSRQLLKQKSIFDFLDPDNVPIAESFLDSRSEVDQGETELTWQGSSGLPFPTIVAVKQRRDDQGQVTGAMLTVTKLVIKAQNDVNYQQILPGLADMAIELDHASRLVREWKRPSNLNFLPSKIDEGTRLYGFI